MPLGKLSNVELGDIDSVSSVSNIAKIDGVAFGFGSPTILRISIPNDGDGWRPPINMYSGTGVIDWGDGTPTEPVTTAETPIQHNYATAGTYDVTVTPLKGDQTRLLSRTSPDQRVTEVVAFGDCGQVGFQQWKALTTIPLDGYLDLANLSVPFWDENLFNECSSFIGPTDLVGYAANLGPAVSMGSLFRQASAFNRGGLGQIDTSSVTSLESCFKDCDVFDNGGVSGVGLGIDNWDVSNVSNFSNTFHGTGEYVSPGIYTSGFYLGSWNTASATDMSEMFRDSSLGADNASGIGNWNVSGVTDFSSSLRTCRKFNEDLGSWNTSSATDMSYMFEGTFRFNNGDPIGSTGGGVGIGMDNWNTSLVTDMSYMFRGTSWFSQYIGSWDTSLVTDMSYMFTGIFQGFSVGSGQSLGIENWNTSSVTDMTHMFYLTVGAPIAAINGNWDFSNVVSLDNFCAGPDVVLSSANLNSLQTAQFALDGANDANASATLVGWANNVNTNTGVDASNLFGTTSINESFFSDAKAAYDTLVAPVSSGGKGWTITGITWIVTESKL